MKPILDNDVAKTKAKNLTGETLLPQIQAAIASTAPVHGEGTPPKSGRESGP